MSCRIEQAIEDRLITALRVDKRLNFTPTQKKGQYKATFSGSPVIIDKLINGLNNYAGGQVVTLTADGTTYYIDIAVPERVVNLYLAKSNGKFLNEEIILVEKQLKARKDLTPKKLFKELKEIKVGNKNLVSPLDKGQLEAGHIYIVEGNEARAQKVAEELRWKYGFTPNQLKVEAYTKKPSRISDKMDMPRKSQIAYRFKLGLSPVDRTRFNKSQQELEAEANINLNSEEDYIIPFGFQNPSGLTYDGFNYGNHISKKMELIKNLEYFANTLQNMGNISAKKHSQIQNIKSLVRSLKKDLSAFEDPTLTLQNYFDHFNKNILSLDNILKRGSIEDLIVVKEYLNMLDLIDSAEPEGFLTDSTDKILEDSSVSLEDKALIKQLIDEFKTNLDSLKKRYNTKKDLAIKKLLSDYYKNTSGEVDTQEIEKIYTEKINGLLEDLSLVERGLNSIENVVNDKNLLGAVSHEILARSVENNNKKALLQNLFDIKSIIENKLISEGKQAVSGFFGKLSSKASYEMFFRKTETDTDFSYRLANLFSEKWEKFTSQVTRMFEDIEDIEYRPNKTEQDYDLINRKRTQLHAALITKGRILDITKTPEFYKDPEIRDYLPEEVPDNSYKDSLIKEIGASEYQKLVDSQRDNIYSFLALKENIEQEYLKRNDVLRIEDLPTKDYNSYHRIMATNSPFISNINTQNKATAKYRNEKGKDVDYLVPSSLKFSSYTANVNYKNGEFVDKRFQKEIASDPEYFRAWQLFDEALTYINSNNNKSARDKVHNQITSQTDFIREFLVTDRSYLSLITAKSFDWIKNIMSTATKKDTDQKLKLSSGVSTVENVVNSNSRVKILTAETVLKENQYVSSKKENVEEYLKKTLKIPDYIINAPNMSLGKAIKEYEKLVVLNSQSLDFIDTLSSQIEMIEAHKAKKESEATLNFLLSKLKEQKDKQGNSRGGAIELLSLFIEKKVYDVNNMSNFGKITRFFKTYEKPVVNEITKAVSILKERLEAVEKELEVALTKDLIDEKNNLEKEIKSLEDYIDTKARDFTAGSILEAVFFKTTRFVVFYANFSTQFTNYAMGNISGIEMDGKLWKEGNIYKAKSHTRRWRTPLLKLNPKAKEGRIKRDLLINRLKVFQNSANDIFNVTESKVKSTTLKVLKDGMQLPGEVEKTIQRPQILAMLGDENLIYIENKKGEKFPLYNLDSFEDPLPAFTLEDGRLGLHPDFDTPHNRETWLDNSSDQFAHFFGDAGIIPKNIAITNGNYRNLSVYTAEKRMGTALFFMFKRWLAETLNKKFGAYDQLYKAKHGTEALNINMQTAVLQGLNVGSILGPIAPVVMGTLLAARSINQTKKMHEAEIGKSLDTSRYLAESLRKTLISKTFWIGSIRTGVAGGVKSAQIIANTLTGRNVIDNDTINSIAGYNNFTGTPEEVAESKANLQYLTTALAYSLIMTGVRLLVHALMYPDDEPKEDGSKSEEDAYREMVDSNVNFWERLMKSPKMTAYYMFENQSQKVLADINFIHNIKDFPAAVLPLTENRSVGNIQKLIESIDYQMKNGNYTKGKHAGRNRVVVQASKVFIPNTFDDMALGFNTSSERDWSQKDLFDEIFKTPELPDSEFQKAEKKRLELREIKKAELEETYKKVIPNKKEREKAVLKEVNQLYPSIKKYYVNGKLVKGNEFFVNRYKN